MAGELPIGIPQILSTVTICVCLIAFILQIHEARESDAIDAGDHVLVGAFGANVMSFILVWFVAGSPADHGSDWVVTFSLHTFIAAVLHLIFVILASEQREVGVALPGQTTAAIVLAALNFPILFYLAIHHYIAKIISLKDNLKATLCSISLILTIIAFTCWLTAHAHHAESVHDIPGWMNGVFIAASLTAGLAAIDGLFTDLGNEKSFAFNSVIGSILSAIFFISAAVEIQPQHQTPTLLVAIIFAAVNCVILFFMGHGGRKGSLQGKSMLELVLLGICILTVVQFAIAMGVEQDNNGEGTGTGITWQHSVLALGAASVFCGLFFSFIFFDHNARGIHIFLGLVCYLVFFVSDCVEASEHAETTQNTVAIVTVAQQRAYRARITALVAAAGNVLLLAIASFLTFPHIRTPAEAPDVDDTASPPKTDSESSA